MIFSTRFVSATRDFTTCENNGPAPYLRREFLLENAPRLPTVKPLPTP